MAGVKKNKELNLLTALDRGRQRKKIGKGAIVVVALIAVIVAAVGLFFAYTLEETDTLTERRDRALAYVDDPETQAQYNESLANQQEARTATIRSETLTGAIDAINSYPDLTGDDYKKLYRIAGGNVQLSGLTYDRTTGGLSFGATCGAATRVPIFIAALRSCGLFSDVAYSGYSGGSRTVPGETQTLEDGTEVTTQITVAEYSFSVNCVVNSDEERAIARARTETDEAFDKALEEATDGANDETTDGATDKTANDAEDAAAGDNKDSKKQDTK
jgi:hypothetical protein